MRESRFVMSTGVTLFLNWCDNGSNFHLEKDGHFYGMGDYIRRWDIVMWCGGQLDSPEREEIEAKIRSVHA